MFCLYVCEIENVCILLIHSVIYVHIIAYYIKHFITISPRRIYYLMVFTLPPLPIHTCSNISFYIALYHVQQNLFVDDTVKPVFKGHANDRTPCDQVHFL